MLKEEWEDYFKKYEKLYKVEMEKRKREIPKFTKLLELFYDEIDEFSDIDKLMTEAMCKIEKDLEYNKNQKRLFEYWQTCEEIIFNNAVEYAFIYGYSLATGLNEESKKMKNKYSLNK